MDTFVKFPTCFLYFKLILGALVLGVFTSPPNAVILFGNLRRDYTKKENATLLEKLIKNNARLSAIKNLIAT